MRSRYELGCAAVNVKDDNTKHNNTNREEALCPLCGKPNGCAVVAGDDLATCWCMTTKVPAELRLMAQSERKRKCIAVKSCICRSCVDAFVLKKK